MEIRLATTLLMGASVLALASPAFAQDTAPAPAAAPAQAAAADADADSDGGGEIVITGSRIVRDGYTAPTPVTVATVQDLVRATPSNIPDALNKLPQFQNSLSPSKSALNFANFPIAGNILNLRSLGVPSNNPSGPLRTLILFDGVRVPPTTYLGTVDTNVIPNILIQRVDIVTGGASAGYGSDAVAGVVNFVLDKKFKGLKGVVQAGVSERGDNGNQRIGLAGGFDFAGGAGHILLSGEYFHNGGMLRSDRKTGAVGWTFVGSVPGCVNPTPTVVTRCQPGGDLNPYIAQPSIRITAASNYGKISSAPAGNPFLNYVFDVNGNFRPFQNGTATGSAFQIGGDGYTIPSDVTSIAPLKTYQSFGRASYEVAPDVEVFAQGVFARSDVRFASLANSFVPPTGATIFQGNPYLPSVINATLTPGQSLLIGEYNGPGPKPLTKSRTDFWMATGGVDGKFADRFNWSLTYTHGQSVLKTAQSGLYDWRKTYAALDAVVNPANGQVTCRVLLDPVFASAFSGCQPLNVLRGDPSVATPAGYAYATGTSRYRARITQDSVQANISGSLFDLPAGPVDVAIGAEYRKQKLKLTSNANPSLLDTDVEREAYFAGLRGVPRNASGSLVPLFYWLTNVGVANGSVNVKEAYAEIAVPILKDTPFFQELSINGAARITDYSTSGSVKTWKVGATWRPIQDLLVRSTLSRDIRAPNLFELFAGDQSGIGIVNDVASGITQNVSSLTGGNPNLKPEIAKTFTAGVVVSPQALRGFSLSVDYYKIKVDKLIGSLSAQQIITNCNSSGGSAPECALITRATPTSFPSLVRISPANIAFLKTAGIDIDASYRSNLGNGAFGIRLYANYLDKFDSQQFAGAPILHYAGINVVGSNPAGFPRWRGSLTLDYSIGGFGVTVNEQYIGKMKLGAPGSIGLENFVKSHVSPVFYTDLNLRYELPAWSGTVELFGNINNLFDKKPPLIPGITPTVNLPTNLAMYDTVGRAFTMGARFKF